MNETSTKHCAYPRTFPSLAGNQCQRHSAVDSGVVANRIPHVLVVHLYQDVRYQDCRPGDRHLERDFWGGTDLNAMYNKVSSGHGSAGAMEKIFEPASRNF